MSQLVEVKLFHSDFDSDHLETVTTEMRDRGAPIVRVVENQWEQLCAIEGCHRLRAAHALGLNPTLETISKADASGIIYAESGDWYSEEDLSDLVDGEYHAVWIDFE